ncbi:hypothetical protein B0O99DRAFT_669267 [Bisporella sp. PMI_857]|nr:hypothetical protein B0O99DRAFT_669267 [Bisporella sp. PMI_857]
MHCSPRRSRCAIVYRVCMPPVEAATDWVNENKEGSKRRVSRTLHPPRQEDIRKNEVGEEAEGEATPLVTCRDKCTTKSQDHPDFLQSYGENNSCPAGTERCIAKIQGHCEVGYKSNEGSNCEQAMGNPFQPLGRSHNRWGAVADSVTFWSPNNEGRHRAHCCYTVSQELTSSVWRSPDGTIDQYKRVFETFVDVLEALLYNHHQIPMASKALIKHTRE